MRAAAEFAWRTDRRSPVGERMIFMAAEHAARGAGPPAGALAEDSLRGLGGRFDADWICPPALALSRLRFRIWSPSNPAMLRDLLEGIDRLLAQQLGRIISLRRWRDRLEEISRGKHGRSRLADAGHAFAVEPFMTSRILADRLSITQRGAINLLTRLTEEGLIVEMTRRGAARIWATPGLARILTPAGRAPRESGLRGGRPSARLEDLPKAEPSVMARNLREEGQADIDRALAAFDDVLSRVDGILGKRA